MSESAELFHPGEYLCDELHARKLDPHEFARSIGISPHQFQAICQQKEPLTLTVAAHLSKAWGMACETWVNLQAAYTIGQLREIGRDLIRWAEANGELDAVWVQTDLGVNASDIANTESLFARIRASAKQIDAERGL